MIRPWCITRSFQASEIPTWFLLAGLNSASSPSSPFVHLLLPLCIWWVFEPSLYHHIQNTTNTNSGPAIQSSVCQSAIGGCFHYTIPTLLWYQCVYIISYTHFYRPFNTSLHRLNCWTRAQWLRSFFSCSNYTLGMFGPSFRRRFNVHI